MDQSTIQKSLFRFLIPGSILLTGMMILNSIHSIQYYNPDEHYQIIEFAGYKQGLVSETDLAWEFEAKSRQAIQPFIAYVVFIIADTLGFESPVEKIQLLRLFMILLVVPTIFLFVKNTLHHFHPSIRKLYIFSSFTIWIVPYYYIRFTSETFSGILFLLSAGILLNPNKKKIAILIAGFIIGLACYSRFQTILPLLGFIIGLWIFEKFNLRQTAILITGFIVAFGLGLIVDFWFYGEWVFTPGRYIEYQIIKNVANDFGTEPFYYYLPLLLKFSTPFLGIMLFIILIGTPAIKGVNTLYLTFMSSLVLLSILGHKEFRFLIPVLLIIPYVYFSFVNKLHKEGYFFLKFFSGRIMLALLTIANITCFTYYTMYNNNWFTDNPKALTYVLAEKYRNSSVHMLYVNNDHPFKDDVVLKLKEDTLHLYQRFLMPENFSDSQIQSISNESLARNENMEHQLLYIRKGVLLKMDNYRLIEQLGYQLIYISAPPWLDHLLNQNKLLGNQYNDWVFYLYELK